MPNNVSAESYTINVEKAGYCILTANTNSTYTAGEKKQLYGLEEVTYTPQLSKGKKYGDGAIKKNIAKLTGATLKANFCKVPIEDRAAILGQTYENGLLYGSVGDHAPEIAFYYEMTGDDGNKEQVWFFAGVAQPFGKTAKQSEENLTFSSDELTIECKPRNIDGKIFAWGDTANADLTQQASTTFEQAPPQPVTA